MKIEELQFTVRTYHALKRAGINTIEQLQRLDDNALFKLRNIGKLSMAEIRTKVQYIPTELPPLGSGCVNCPVKPCQTMKYRGSTCVAQRDRYGLGDPKTIADMIRDMSDQELCDAFFQLIYAAEPAAWFCNNSKECGDLMDAEKDIPDEMCKACLLAKLRQPAAETPRPVRIHEDKEESGLLEE